MFRENGVSVALERRDQRSQRNDGAAITANGARQVDRQARTFLKPKA